MVKRYGCGKKKEFLEAFLLLAIGRIDRSQPGAVTVFPFPEHLGFRPSGEHLLVDIRSN
jgi:hypothetical protein